MARTLTVGWLQDTRARQQRAFDDADARCTKLSTAAQEIADTPGLTNDFKREKLEALRAPAVDAVTAAVNDSDAALALVESQKPFWASVEFQLSRQTFNADPAIDSAIKLQKQTEFSAMSASLLQMVANAALAEEDLPTLWVAVNVARQYADEPAWSGIDLTSVVLPDMTAALTAIAAVESLNVLIHQRWVRARGQIESPVSSSGT